jgi:hypothetical protein
MGLLFGRGPETEPDSGDLRPGLNLLTVLSAEDAGIPLLVPQQIMT